MDKPHTHKEITLTEAFIKVAKDKRKEIALSVIFWPALALLTGVYLYAPIGIVSNGMQHVYDAYKYKSDVNAPTDNERGFLKEHFGRALDFGTFMGAVTLFMTTLPVTSVLAFVGLGVVSGYAFECLFSKENKNAKSGNQNAPQVP